MESTGSCTAGGRDKPEPSSLTKWGWYVRTSRLQQLKLTHAKGKTVQMTTLIGLMVKKHEASPILVVVPNSTLTNWVRGLSVQFGLQSSEELITHAEFERWAPHVRVVPFYGDANSRKIIKQYELHHETAPRGCTTHKFHVLLATYEAFTNVKVSCGPP